MPQRQKDRNLLFISVIVCLMAAPAGLATGYYLFSGDPRVRPLAATRQSEALGQGRVLGIEIVARIRWGSASSAAFSLDDLKQMIDGAFYSHGAEARIVTERVAGSDITVTYEVGENAFGPTSVDRAALNVRAAIGAYRLALAER